MIFAIWLLAFIITCYTRSFIASTIAGILLVPMLGVGHNFIHQRPNYFKYFYDVSGFGHT